MVGIIYCAENSTNGDCYIGQTIKTLRRRMKGHLNSSKKSNTYFGRALKKYDDWNWYIVQEYEAEKDVIKSILNKAEIYYIDVFDSYNDGYNMNKGGDSHLGGIPWNKGKGKKYDIKPKTKRVPWNKGKTGIYSVEALESNRQKHLGIKQSEETITKKVQSRCGYTHSEETKAKIGRAHTGKKASKEAKANMSIAAKNKPPVSDETKKKLKEATQRYWDNKKLQKGK